MENGKVVIVISILFFATSILCGFLIYGLMQDRNNDKIDSLQKSIEQNHVDLVNLVDLIGNIKDLQEKEYPIYSKSEFEHIEYLIEKLKDDNNDLEDELDDLRKDFRNIIPLIPTSFY